jgi:N-acetylglutamate synthase-like GNAT family acetyltransferase
MILARWLRFGWDLKLLPGEKPALAPPFRIRQAEKADLRRVSDLLLSNFALDADWTDLLQEMRARLEDEIETVFEEKAVPCLVVTLGHTIVGASALEFGIDRPNHLISGPSITAEYRNRGIGSALLDHSLRFLKENGIEYAYGITRAGVPTAKFLYTKFNSTNIPSELEPLAACS